MAKEIRLATSGSGSADFTSNPQPIGDILYYGVQVNFTGGTATGTVFVQGSIDGTNFANIPGASASITAGGSHIIDVGPAGHERFRVFYDRTAGTDTIDIFVMLKQVAIAQGA